MSEIDDSARAARIAALERAAADALPCAVTERVDGWRLRFHHGITRRANSVLAEGVASEGAGARTPSGKIVAAEDFYRHHGQPPRFQLSPASQPPGLDGMLDARGYRREPGARVQVCDPGALRARGDDFEWRCDVLPSPRWRALLAGVDPQAATVAEWRAEALAAAGIEARHCLVARAGVAMAVGLGVWRNGRLGLFNMASRADRRRRGAGGAVVAALAGWAGGETTLYLQVAPANHGALAFYARLGFTTLYDYHYRVLERG